MTLQIYQYTGCDQRPYQNKKRIKAVLLALIK